MSRVHVLLAKSLITGQKIKKSLIHRKGRWRKFRKYITSRAQILFMYLLAERAFRGRIIANHTDKMLDISVSGLSFLLKTWT